MAPADLDNVEVLLSQEAGKVEHHLPPSTSLAGSTTFNRATKRQNSSIGMDEQFRLHHPHFHIPFHVWGEGHLPHMLIQKKSKLVTTCGTRIRKLIHVPAVPFAKNWKHHRKHLLADLFAGITCGVMLIPQGMAYMLLASLPSIIGLHTATIGPMFFAFLGTTRNILSVGPVALSSIYLPTALQELGFNTQSNTPEALLQRAQVASSLTFWIGIIFLLMSIFRMGGLIRFLSFSVMSGFTSAAGLYVGLSQLKHILEIHPPQFHYHYQQFYWMMQHVSESNPRTTTLGFVSLFFLLLVKFLKRRYPPTPAREKDWRWRTWRILATFATLIVVATSAGVSYYLDQHDKGIPIVGKIESGLSKARFPAWGHDSLELATHSLIFQALPVALLAYMESYAVGRKMAEENRVQLAQNQDLFALGLGNIVSSCFSTFVAAGSFGRTALAQEVGAKTTMANLFMGLFVIVTLLLFTSALEFIPLAVLGAVIESAIINLIDIREMRRALRVAPLSGCVMLFTFFCTFLLTIESGLLYGVVCSLGMLLYQLSTVMLTELGLDEEDDGLRFVSLDEHPNATHTISDGIAVVRPVSSLFFGNAVSFRHKFHRLLERKTAGEDEEEEDGEGSEEGIEEKMDDEEEAIEMGKFGLVRKTGIHHVLIDACAIRVLDLTALGAIADVVEEAQEKGVSVVITNTSHALKKSLAACGLLERLGGEMVTQSTEEVYAKLILAVSSHRHKDHPEQEQSEQGQRPRSDSNSSATFHQRFPKSLSAQSIGSHS